MITPAKPVLTAALVAILLESAHNATRDIDYRHRPALYAQLPTVLHALMLHVRHASHNSFYIKVIQKNLNSACYVPLDVRIARPLMVKSVQHAYPGIIRRYWFQSIKFLG